MTEEDDRWLPPDPENKPPAPSVEGLPGSFSAPAYPTPEQPGSQWGQPANAPTTPKNGTNGNAVAALVLGIIGLPIICPLLAPSIIALVLGYRARRQVRETGQEGGGMATAGIVMGWIGTIVGALIWIGVILGMIFGDDRDGDGWADWFDAEPDDPKANLIAPLLSAVARAALAIAF